MVNLCTFIPPSAQVNPLVDVGECHWPFPRHTKWESALVYIRPPRQSLSKLQCPPDVHSLLTRLVLVSPMRKVFWRMQRPSHIYMTAWLYSEKGNRPTGFGFSSSDTVVWKKTGLSVHCKALRRYVVTCSSCGLLLQTLHLWLIWGTATPFLLIIWSQGDGYPF